MTAPDASPEVADVAWYKAELDSCVAEIARQREVIDDLWEQIRAAALGADPSDHTQRARAILLANQLTLSTDERHELAEWLLDFRGSWSRLPEVGARRLADALSAFIGMQALLAARNDRAR